MIPATHATAAEALAAADQAIRLRDFPAALAALDQATRKGASLKQTARLHAFALSEMGRHAEAIETFKPWFVKNQKDVDTLNLMGVLLKRDGRLKKAAEVLETARKRKATDLASWHNLGNVYDLLGDYEKAAESFRGAARLSPRTAELWRLHGRALMSQSKYAEAVESLQRAHGLAPDNQEIIAMLTGVLQQAGRAEEALELTRKLRIEGRSTADLAVIEARLAFRAGDAPRAQAMLEEVLAEDPAHLNAAILLAIVIGDSDREAVNRVFAASLEHNPDSQLLRDRYIDSLARSRYGSETAHLEESYRQAKLLMERFPTTIQQSSRSLRTVLMRVLDEDLMAQTGTLDELLPVWLAEGSHSAVHYELGQVASMADRLKLVDWHRDWGRKASAAIRAMTPEDRAAAVQAAAGGPATATPAAPDAFASPLDAAFGAPAATPAPGTGGPLDAAFGDPAPAPTPAPAAPPQAAPPVTGRRKVRVGFMSSDLRHHPVTYFTLPLLEGFDPDAVEVFCYSFYEGQPDQVQTLLTRKVTGFRHWPKRPDAQVAEGIAADDLDILFELGGSTAMNKLMVMAYRPARIGASWLGYPHSAGLEQIDMILVDPYIKPEVPELLIEQPFEMPESWVALSRMFAPHEIAEGTPEARKGHLTFGTANNPYKFTPACLDAWAAVLRAVPGARFLFLRPEAGSESFIANTRTAFARRDVDPDRLDYIGVRGDHMRHYNEIDIALDSLPHVGGTTTCETLWMGVPTISLAGPGFPERLSYSNLSNAGLGDLAVFSVEDYVARSVELAEDRARRAALRQGLRAQIRAHPLGQPERFTAAFYAEAAKVARQ